MQMAKVSRRAWFMEQTYLFVDFFTFEVKA